MSTTAFVHASVAIPNCTGQPSLILENNNDKPFIYNIIKSCVEAEKLDKVIVITSDNPADDVIASIVKEFSTSKVKSFKINSQLSYSFQPDESKLRDVSFPYLWYPAYGLYNLEGFKALTAQFKVTDAILIEASYCGYITVDFINQVCENIKDKAVRYFYRNPYREVMGVNVQFMNDLMRTYMGKLQDKVLSKGGSPLLQDIFQFAFSEDRKKYSFPKSGIYRDNLFPLLRKQELKLIECLMNNVWEDYANHFETIRNYLYPLIPEYLELELIDEKQNGKLSPDRIKNIILDFASSGIVLNFSGTGDPLNDDRLAEYIKYAKDQNIISVWLETKGTLLDENKITKLIESKLDLLLINANEYINDKERLSALISLIAEIKRHKDSLFPLVALQCSVAPWLNKQADEFITFFEKSVPRIVIRTLGNYGEENTVKRTIDFSPLQRSTCRQIYNSIFVKANNNVGICSRDRKGLISLGEKADKKTADILNSEIQEKIIKEQNEMEIGRTFDKCLGCKDWYIPNIHNSFYNISFPSCVHNTHEHYSVDFDKLMPDELDKHEEKLCSIINICDKALKGSYDLLASYMKRISGQKKSSGVSNFIDNQVQYLRQHIKNMELFKYKFMSYYVPLGDAFIYHKMYEKGLLTWERVLKSDPSNTYIHKRLDELLAEVNNPA